MYNIELKNKTFTWNDSDFEVLFSVSLLLEVRTDLFVSGSLFTMTESSWAISK